MKKCAFCEKEDINIFEKYLVDTRRTKCNPNQIHTVYNAKIQLCQNCIDEKIELEKDFKSWDAQLMQICKKSGSTNLFSERKIAILETIQEQVGGIAQDKAPTNPGYTSRNWTGNRS